MKNLFYILVGACVLPVLFAVILILLPAVVFMVVLFVLHRLGQMFVEAEKPNHYVKL